MAVRTVQEYENSERKYLCYNLYNVRNMESPCTSSLHKFRLGSQDTILACKRTLSHFLIRSCGWHSMWHDLIRNSPAIGLSWHEFVSHNQVVCITTSSASRRHTTECVTNSSPDEEYIFSSNLTGAKHVRLFTWFF